MSAIMKIKQARTPEQIAEELEPLAVSLAILANQVQESIEAVGTASANAAQQWANQRAETEAASVAVTRDMAMESRKQAMAWQQAQTSATQTAADTAKTLEAATARVARQIEQFQHASEQLQAAATSLKNAQKDQAVTMMIIAGGSAMCAALLSTAFWLWLAPSPPVYLDNKAIAEQLKPAIQEALAPAKRK